MSQLTILRPWRAFERDGQIYLINVQGVFCRKIKRSTLEIVRRVEANPGAHLSENDEIRLLNLELVKTDTETAYDIPLRAGAPRKTKGRRPPFDTLVLFVSQLCNFRCIYCFGVDGNFDAPGVMPETMARKAVDWLLGQANGKKHLRLVFFGGEPTLSFHLVIKIVSYAEERGRESGVTFTFSMSTNGTPQSDNNLNFIREHSFKLLISLDGPAAIQDRNRIMKGRLSSYAVVTPWIHRVVEAGIPTFLRATVWNSGELHDVLCELESLPCRGYWTDLAQPTLRETGAISSNPPIRDELIGALWARIRVFIKRCKKRDLAVLQGLLRWKFFRSMTRIIEPQGCGRGYCNAGRTEVVVSTEGGLYPCASFNNLSDYAMGSLDAPEWIDNDIYWRNTMGFDECADCWARAACYRGCLLDNLIDTGDMFTPDPAFCSYIKQLMEAAMYLDAQLDSEDRKFLHQERLILKRSSPLG